MRTGVLVAILAVCVAGCAGPASQSLDGRLHDAFPDADKRFGNATTGDHSASYSFRLPEGSTRLLVKAGYRAASDASFVLVDPKGNGQKFDTFRDAKTMEPRTWFDQFNAPLGTWKLNVHLQDGGAYMFGVYWEP